VGIIEDAGYRLIGHFTLPESAWWDYYTPIEKRIPLLRDRYAGDQEAQDFLDASQEESDMYRKHSSDYGYVFYVMRLAE
jgi:hypothetical protein